MLGLWPEAERIDKGPSTTSRSVPRRKRRVPEHPRSWSNCEGTWACRACLTTTSTDKIKARRHAEQCPGFAARMAQVLTSNNFHALAALDTSKRAAVVCRTCGAWATKNPKLLLAKCHGGVVFCAFVFYPSPHTTSTTTLPTPTSARLVVKFRAAHVVRLGIGGGAHSCQDRLADR